MVFFIYLKIRKSLLTLTLERHHNDQKIGVIRKRLAATIMVADDKWLERV
jgi:hypothetical protein